MGRRLQELPTLDKALARGDVGWTKAREVVRVATLETEAAWTARAQDVNSRELEALVAGSTRGEAPPPPDAALKAPAYCRLTYAADAADAAVIRDALAVARAALGPDGRDANPGELLASICRAHLERLDGAEAPTGVRYQTVVQLCPRCDAVSCPEHEVSDEVVAEAACDSEVVDLRPGPKHGHVSRTIPPAVRRAVMLARGGRCGVPSGDNRCWVDVHHLRARADGGTDALENLIALCTQHHRAVHDGTVSLRRLRSGELELVRCSGKRRVWRPATHVGLGVADAGRIANRPRAAR